MTGVEFGKSNRRLFTVMGEPTGFPNRTDSSLSWSDSSPDRTLTIAPTGTHFRFYQDGGKYTKTSSDTVQITDVEGEHYIYYDAGVLTVSVNPDTSTRQTIIQNKVIVSIVYWDATNNTAIYVADERHGLNMDGSTHAYLHFTQGTKWISGLALGNFQADGTGDSDADAQFSCGNGIIQDEDISLNITDGSPQDLSPILQAPVFYKTGASGDWRMDTATNFPVKSFVGGSGRLAWNELTGGSWQQTEVTNGRYVLCHIFATNDISHPIIAIQGEAEYINIVVARDGATTEINNLVTTGLPFEEFTPLGSIIYQTDTSYTNTVKARVRTTDEGENYVDFREFRLASTGSVNDHGSLSGLLDDDHPQYALLNGRTGDILKIDQIDEFTTDNGVVIEGVTLKDSQVSAPSDINTGTHYEIGGFTVLAIPTTNTLVGKEAGNAGPLGSTVCVGYQAGYSNTAGQSLYIGTGAGKANTAGWDNTYVGHNAGLLGTTGGQNTYVGGRAGNLARGSNNIFIGYQTGFYNNTGSANTFVGTNSGVDNTSGGSNVFIGNLSGYNATTGSNNTFLGTRSALNLIGGANNTFVGYLTGSNSTSSSGCVFIGYQAGSNETGNNKLYIENSSSSSPLIYGEFDNDFLRFNATITDINNNLLRLGTGLSIKESSGTLWVRNTDDTAFANLQCQNATHSGTTTMQGAATITNSSSSSGLYIDQNVVATTSALDVDTNGVDSKTGYFHASTSAATTDLVHIEQGSSTATRDCLHIANAGTSTNATLNIVDTAAGRAIRANCNVSNSVDLVLIEQANSASTGASLYLLQAGSGDNLTLDRRGTSGNLLDINFGAATTLAGATSAINIDVSTNVTTNGQTTRGIRILASGNDSTHFNLNGDPANTSPSDGDLWYDGTNLKLYDGSTTFSIIQSDGTTGGSGSAGAGNQYIVMEKDGVKYKVLHDGTV